MEDHLQKAADEYTSSLSGKLKNRHTHIIEIALYVACFIILYVYMQSPKFGWLLFAFAFIAYVIIKKLNSIQNVLDYQNKLNNLFFSDIFMQSLGSRLNNTDDNIKNYYKTNHRFLYQKIQNIEINPIERVFWSFFSYTKDYRLDEVLNNLFLRRKLHFMFKKITHKKIGYFDAILIHFPANDNAFYSKNLWIAERKHTINECTSRLSKNFATAHTLTFLKKYMIGLDEVLCRGGFIKDILDALQECKANGQLPENITFEIAE